MGKNTHKQLRLADSFSRRTAALRQLPSVVMFLLTYLGITVLAGNPSPAAAADSLSGVVYTNYVIENIPWSVHAVLIDRADPSVEIRSVHAGARAIGLDTLTSQIATVTNLGSPLAALNGDFYQRENAFAGDPRGLQIVDHQVLSGPAGGTCLWFSNSGEPNIDTVESRFTVALPNGTVKPFGLNGAVPPDGIELYTPAVGETTHTGKCSEWILEKQNGSAWLPLRMQSTYVARVREVRLGGNSPLAADSMVLAIGPALAKTMPAISTNSVVTIFTGSVPGIADAKTAIGGGPILVHKHKKVKIVTGGAGTFEFSSMAERHPRSAVGWNQKTFFLVEVDGRQKQLSVGMTLDELGAFLYKLGCDEAVSLDGGGSAELWFDGQVRNSPCDGKERPIANSLVVLRKTTSTKPPLIP